MAIGMALVPGRAAERAIVRSDGAVIRGDGRQAQTAWARMVFRNLHREEFRGADGRLDAKALQRAAEAAFPSPK